MDGEYEQLLEKIGSLSQAELVRLIAGTAFELTIQARDVSADSTPASRANHLGDINNVQHFLLGILAGATAGKAVDAQSLASSFHTFSQDARIGERVRAAIQQAAGRLFDTRRQ